jgi:hypothetical protein
MCSGHKNLTKLYSLRVSVIMTVPTNISFFWKGMPRILMEIHEMFYHEVGGKFSLRNFDEHIIWSLKKISIYYSCYKIMASRFILKLCSSLSNYKKNSSSRRQFFSKLRMTTLQIIFNCSVKYSWSEKWFHK